MRNIQGWLSAINVFARFIVTLHANPSRTPTAIGKTFSIRVSFAYQEARICSAINPTFDLFFSPLYIRRGYQTIYLPLSINFYPPILLSCISFWKLILSFTILYLSNPPYTDIIIIKTTSSEILLLNLRLNWKDRQYFRIPLSDIVFLF